MGSEERAFYRWVCPICGASNVGVRTQSDSHSAIEALESHLRGQAGADHGAQYDIPDELARESLESNIELFEHPE